MGRLSFFYAKEELEVMKLKLRSCVEVETDVDVEVIFLLIAPEE